MKYFTDQEIEDATRKATKLIQDEISSGEDTAVAIAGLGKKFNLHIDQIGKIAELTRNLLLGLIAPEEFFKELIVAGISDKDAREIVKEINQKIFIPLREQMRKGEGNIPKPEGATSEPTKPAEPVTTKPMEQPSHFHLENKIDVSPREENKTLPKQIEGEKLLEDHEELHLEIGVSLPEVPKSVSVFAPPKPTTPPINLPGATPPTPVPEVLTSPEIKKEPVSTPPQSSSTPIKTYAVDPYREPIDESSWQ
jgi:hypothetical protein